MEEITPWRLAVAPFEETVKSLLQQVNIVLACQISVAGIILSYLPCGRSQTAWPVGFSVRIGF